MILGLGYHRHTRILNMMKKIWNIIIDFLLYESPFEDYNLCSWSKPPEINKEIYKNEKSI